MYWQGVNGMATTTLRWEDAPAFERAVTDEIEAALRNVMARFAVGVGEAPDPGITPDDLTRVVNGGTRQDGSVIA
jgi:hypothetical protein